MTDMFHTAPSPSLTVYNTQTANYSYTNDITEGPKQDPEVIIQDLQKRLDSLEADNHRLKAQNRMLYMLVSSYHDLAFSTAN